MLTYYTLFILYLSIFISHYRIIMIHDIIDVLLHKYYTKITKETFLLIHADAVIHYTTPQVLIINNMNTILYSIYIILFYILI